jgi:predicted metal-binding membrane protein
MLFSAAARDEIDRGAWLTPLSSLGRAALGLFVALLVLTGAAWAVTLYHAHSMSMPMGIAVRGGLADSGMGGMAMAGMPAAGWSLGGAALFVVVWIVMMAAMMIPAAAPMIVIFASAQARRQQNLAVPTWNFVAGYLLVWAAAGLLVYLFVQIGSEAAGRLTPADRATWGPAALGTTLSAAGLYQFTPLKRICLSHCRSPFAFVAQHWHEGRLGALRMGVHHGGYCLGCCWALFAVLVAAGVMSLAWMLLLTLVVFVEKVVPQGGRTAAVTGAALVGLGLLVSLHAVSMPWLS